MKYAVTIAMACLALLYARAAQTQNVRLTWVGQATFIVQTEGGPTVVADPAAPNVVPLPEVTADVVTVTHNHIDHNYTQGVRGDFTLVDGRPITTRATIAAAGMPFVLIPGFHDGQGGAEGGTNTIIQWTQGGLRFAHLGDIGQDQLTAEQLSDLQNLDVLMVPAGGYFTVAPVDAAALANQVKARVTILMHYRTPVSGAVFTTIAPLNTAQAPFGTVVYKPATVVLNRERLPATPEVWVMEPLAPANVVNSANFAAGVPVAPGSLATVFGNFAGADTLFATSLPLPNMLGQTQVFIGGNPVPLLYVSPSQINLQIPSGLGRAEIASGQQAAQFLVEVRVGGQPVARAPVTVMLAAPGLFGVFNADGSRNSSLAPARRGDTVLMLGTGQGQTPSTSLADGAAAPAAPLRRTRTVPEVIMGGQRAVVESSSLLPGAVGVWQMQVRVPEGAPTGLDLPVTIRFGPISTTITMTIQ